MFRGDLWDVQLPSPIGPRPCVLLTTNALISRLNSVTVAEITSTQGPPSTHIELQTDSGLTGREYSYVNTTALHTVPKGRLRNQHGRLSPTELTHLATAIRRYLDLD